MADTLDEVARRHALLEAIRRWGAVNKPAGVTIAPRAYERMHRVMNNLFDKQKAAAADPSRRLALFTTRRAGKTSLLTPKFIDTALACQDNQATMFVIAPTLEHAKALLWRPLESFNEMFNLGLELRNDPARCRFPNGVMLYFRGAKDREQLGVLRGFKTLLVGIDEIQDIRDEILFDIFQATGPGLRDLNGQMIVSGTPGKVPVGEWFEISTGERPNWSVHSWSLLDNPFLPAEAKNIDLILSEEGLTVDDPRFKREYLGLWVEDGDELVYQWKIEANGLPGDTVVLDPEYEWHYVMGIDFGHRDDSAVVVGAFSFDSNMYFEVAESGAAGLSLDSFMNYHVMPLYRKFNPMRTVGDPQAKQLIATINERWQISVQNADTRGKLAHIETINSDFLMERVKTPVSFKLIQERQRLVWDPGAKPKLIEHPRRPNHYCDAALYAHHEAKHWIARDVKQKVSFATELDREAYYLKQYILKNAQPKSAVERLANWADDDDFRRD